MKPWLRQRSKRTMIIAAVIIITGLAIGVWFVVRPHPPQSALPARVQSQLSFSPFVISDSTHTYTASDYKTSKPEGQVQILSYVVHLPAKAGTVSISEYTQPSQFTDIPEYKSQFLTNVINEYDSVQTSNGTIYLGHATKQNNAQLGFMLERGLVVFLSPSHSLSDKQWHDLGERLVIQKVTY